MIECVCVSLGGLAALMYTDTFQTFVIIAGALVLTGFCKYDLCNIIFNYLMNLIFNSHDRRPMLSACLKPWCPEAAQAGKRLTRVRNHSFWWTTQCADTAEPPRNPQPPTDTTTAAPNCNLIDFSWKGHIYQSNAGYEKVRRWQDKGERAVKGGKKPTSLCELVLRGLRWLSSWLISPVRTISDKRKAQQYGAEQETLCVHWGSSFKASINDWG